MDSEEDHQHGAPAEEVPRSDGVGSEGTQEETPLEEVPRVSPGRFNRIAGLVLVVVALLIVAGVLLSSQGKKPKPRKNESTPKPSDSPLLPLSDRLIGDPSAKVKVIAALPVSVGCRDPIGLYLVSVSKKYSSMVSVRIANMTSEQGRQVMKEHGLQCATVLINGKSSFDLGPGIKDQFQLKGPSFFPADVRRALAAELKAVYADSAPELPPAQE